MLRVRTVLSGWPGAPGLNTFYWTGDAIDESVVSQEVFDRVHTFWTAIAQLFPDEFTATIDQLVDDLDQASGDLVETYSVTGTNAIVGTNTTADFLPAQTMHHLSLKTGVVINSKRVRGGSYIGPMAASTNASNGQMNTASLAVVGAAANDLLATTDGGGLLCVWHRPSPGPGTTDGQAVPVFDVSGRPVWSHLTSRRR